MVRKDLDEFIKTIPEGVTIVAATKYVGAPEMRTLYKHGITNFGENRVENFLAKKDLLRNLKKATWHFIGHLQTNKAKEVANEIDVLHSLDNMALAYELEKYRTVSKPMDVFVEVSINGEPNKNGISIADLDCVVFDFNRFKHLNLVGLMCMSKKDSTADELRKQFGTLKLIRDATQYKMDTEIPCLSMGMSDDYEVALDCGATHIRLGRILFDGYKRQ